jgi:S-formylglutathione hydrolase
MAKKTATLALLPICLSLVLHATAAEKSGDIVYIQIDSPAIEANLVGNAASRRVFAYLPPSYSEDDKRRYPAVYLLHGASRGNTWPSGYYQGMFIQNSMDELIASGDVGEMILVMPDTSGGRYTATFYTDSPLTGGFETFLTQELVDHMDRRYRTLPHAQSRGIAGHSTGGYGAMVLAMKHPDVFGAVYAHDASALSFHEWFATGDGDHQREALTLQRTGEYTDFVGGFHPQMLLAAASSFTPNLGRLPSQVDLPWKVDGDAVKRIDAVWAKWLRFDPLHSLPLYADNLRQLRGIALDGGLHVEAGTNLGSARAFHEGLVDAGIEHEYEEYEGAHGDTTRQQVETRILPFFSAVLAGE